MRKSSKKNVIALVCLMACCTLLSAPLPVRAQGGSLTVTIEAGPATVSPGGNVAAFGRVYNNTTSRLRLQDTFTGVDSCHVKAQMGYGRLTLNPGESILVTVSYPVARDACQGLYEITFSVSSGGKNASATSATTYVTIQ